MRVRKAVIPAAGLGTRFLPATKAQPKEMLPIVDKPTLQFIIEEAVASGIEEVIIDKSVELDMDEYSRIVIEQYYMSHKSKKSLQLRDLLELSYRMEVEPTDCDAILLEKMIDGEKNAEMKEALIDLDDFLFG